MSELPDHWYMPEQPPEVRWVARAALLLMFVVALVWLLSVWRDIALQVSSRWRYAGVALPVVGWMAWVYKRWRQPPAITPMTLQWCATAKPLRLERHRLHRDRPAAALSHWHTLDGRPVSMAVKIDIGSHLLLRIVVSNVVAYHWVRDRDVPGPWRWRVAAHSPVVAQQDEPGRVVNEAHRKDAWHHR